jgi:Putative metallopeptidase
MVLIRSRRASLSALSIAAALLLIAPAAAQPRPELRNDKISFDYYEPRNPKLLPLYQKLPQRNVLERLSEFLAPVRWPKKLRMMMKECPAGTPPPEVLYSKIDYSLTVCYQWFAFLEALNPPAAFGPKQEIVAGGLVGVVLHQATVAVFDMLAVPRLGSESDAADQAAAFVALQFGDDVARAVIKGTYVVWKKYDDDLVGANRQYDFANRTGVPRQRMYNTLCIAYGGAPAVFKNFVDQGDLLGRRAETCEDEYRQVQFAFRATMTPHFDASMMNVVRTLSWLSADDLR